MSTRVELMHAGMPAAQAKLLGVAQQLTLAAAGTTQAAATLLTTNSAILSGGSGGWRLPGSSGSPRHILQVVTAGNLYPATGESINALGQNLPLALTAGTRLLVEPSGAPNWTAFISA
jgi:hypothetical protein